MRGGFRRRCSTWIGDWFETDPAGATGALVTVLILAGAALAGVATLLFG